MKPIPFPTAESEIELDELRHTASKSNYFDLDKFVEEVWFDGSEPNEISSTELHGF